jgi:hypothetical protein
MPRVLEMCLREGRDTPKKLSIRAEPIRACISACINLRNLSLLRAVFSATGAATLHGVDFTFAVRVAGLPAVRSRSATSWHSRKSAPASMLFSSSAAKARGQVKLSNITCKTFESGNCNDEGATCLRHWLPSKACAVCF